MQTRKGYSVAVAILSPKVSYVSTGTQKYDCISSKSVCGIIQNRQKFQAAEPSTRLN